jgi:hypothetical protein
MNTLRIAILLSVLGAFGARAEEAAPPAPPPAAAADPWARFPAGSWVKVRTTAKLSGEPMSEESRFTIMESAQDSYTLKIETTVGGDPMPVTTLEVPIGATPEPEWTWADRGNEDVDVDGKPVACAVRMGTSGDGKSTKETWTSEVGGRVVAVRVKLRLWSAGSIRSEETRVVKFGESLRIGEKTATCTVKEQTIEQENFRTTARVWETEDIPGGIAKESSVDTAGTFKSETTREVTDFEVKK